MIEKETVIPKMDYIITTKEGRLHYVDECIVSILKQSNLNNIIFLNKEDFDTGHFFLKVLGAKMAKTEYVVVVDDDVCLKDNWIEDMWSYVGDNISTGGFVYLNKKHYQRARSLSYPKVADIYESRLQNSIVKRKWLSSFSFQHIYGIDAGTYFGGFLLKKGYYHYIVPVFSKHVSNHQATPLREGIRGGSRRRYMGLYSLSKLIKEHITMLFGGIKLFIKYKDIWYLKHTILQRTGNIYGFLKWNECLEEYDYG